MLQSRSVGRIALGQKDALHLISVQGLSVSADADYNLHAVDRNQISRKHGAIAQFDGVVRSAAKFIADATAGSVVRADLQRKLSRAEPFLGEPEAVFAHRQLH